MVAMNGAYDQRTSSCALCEVRHMMVGRSFGKDDIDPDTEGVGLWAFEGGGAKTSIGTC